MDKTTLNCSACSQRITLLKKEIAWLKEVDKFALQNSLKALKAAYKNFFADLKNLKSKKRFCFSQFNKHSSKQAYKTNTNGNIQIRHNYLKLPKRDWIKFHKSQSLTGKLISVTVWRTKTGFYTASVLDDLLAFSSSKFLQAI